MPPGLVRRGGFAWASGHRTHHLHVDDVDRDPYSARRGFWFSHIGWMLREYPSGRNDFTNIPDLKKDRMLAFQHRYYVPLALAANFGLTLRGRSGVRRRVGHADPRRLAAPGVEPSRHLLHQLARAHVGQPPYTEDNSARDNPLIAVVTYGEGYHNFHHIFAHDYRNGVRWWQWDPTKWLIAGLERVGLARRLKRTPVFQIRRALLAMQFTRAEAQLARLPGVPSQVEHLRARLAHEYESFLAAVADWARLKEQWLEEKKRAVLEQWEHVDPQKKLRDIERALGAQLRRMRVLRAQLAY